MTSSYLVVAPLTSLALGAILVGGGIYETLLVDRVWPDNVAIIQPKRGGLDRGLFWAPLHTLYELALIVAVWMVWSVIDARWWMIAALVIHLGARAWSFMYFIPKALRFEKAGELTAQQQADARRWTQLSRVRPVLEAASVLAQAVAVMRLAIPFAGV